VRFPFSLLCLVDTETASLTVCNRAYLPAVERLTTAHPPPLLTPSHVLISGCDPSSIISGPFLLNSRALTIRPHYTFVQSTCDSASSLCQLCRGALCSCLRLPLFGLPCSSASTLRLHFRGNASGLRLPFCGSALGGGLCTCMPSCADPNFVLTSQVCPFLFAAPLLAAKQAHILPCSGDLGRCLGPTLALCRGHLDFSPGLALRWGFLRPRPAPPLPPLFVCVSACGFDFPNVWIELLKLGMGKRLRIVVLERLNFKACRLLQGKSTLGLFYFMLELAQRTKISRNVGASFFLYCLTKYSMT